MMKIEKKYQYLLIGLLGVIIIISIINVNHKIKIKKFQNDYYNVRYDSTWKLKDSKDEVLLTGKESMISIQSLPLEEEYRYLSIDELNVMVEKSLARDNPNYQLIAREKDKITKYQYDGVKLLYEDKKGKKQSLVESFKMNNHLIIIHYSATTDYFDIKLDSVKEIVYQLRILDNNKPNTTKVKLKEKDISWKGNLELTNNLKTREDEIFSNHYQVIYEIPEILKSNSYHSESGIYTSDLKKGTLRVSTNVVSGNIYEVLEKYNEDSEDYRFKIVKKEKNYKSFLSTYQEGYLFKYQYTSQFKSKIEYYVIFYPINNSHTFTVTIDTKDVNMPKEFMNHIKIKKVHNYANHLTSVEKDGYLVGTLKSGSKREENSIELSLPLTYQEVDKSGISTVNSYETKYYTNGRNDVIYSFLKGTIENRVKIQNATFIENKKLNEQECSVYKDDKDRLLLYFSVTDDYYLEVIISSEREITNQDMEVLTNFHKE